ncbi:unnamed protein product, partial [Heterosigma akashiwo]
KVASRIAGDPELASSLLGMFESAELSDVSLVCQDTTFRCHKFILSARSPVFKAMFTRFGMAEGHPASTVKITDVKPSAMKALLNFMYSGLLECEPEDQLDFLAVADKYDVQGAKNWCEENFIGELGHEPASVARIIQFTELHENMKCLRYAALQKLHTNRDEVMSSDTWEILAEESPRIALKAI